MLSDRIKELRELHQLSQAAFAKAIGVSGASVGYYENNKTKPGKMVIEKICEIYGVTPEWLQGEASVEKAAEAAETTDTKQALMDAEEAPAEEAARTDEAVPSEEPQEAEKTGAKKSSRKLKASEPEKEKKNPRIVIESLLGGSISVDEVYARVRVVAPDAMEIYVKPEENKAYWVGKGKNGFVDLWS